MNVINFEAKKEVKAAARVAQEEATPKWVKVGQMVTFEVDGNIGFPRWHMGVDKAKGGEWASGVIEDVKHNIAWVRFTIWPDGRDSKGRLQGESTPALWRWPLPGHPEYKAELWVGEGYMQPVR